MKPDLSSPPPSSPVDAVAEDALLAPRADRYGTFLFGVCYYPEQWPADFLERDATRMRECGVNVVRMAEFGWAVMEPSERAYDFSLFDHAIEVMAREGIRTILGTPTAAPPKWLTSAYPDVLHAYEDGRPADAQSRRHYCYNSPRYRDLARRIVAAMARHYRDNLHVIGWQIDNEMNNENRGCFSHACRAAFQRWLEAKYGTLDCLNERWGTVFWSQTYSAWGQIDLPGRTPAVHNPALFLDHRRFVSDSATSFLEDQIRILRAHRPNDFVTHNGMFPGIDYHRFARNLDLHAHDNYPTFHADPRIPTAAALATCRGFNGRMMVMEQITGPAGQSYVLRTPAPGQVPLWTMQAIAHGADGIVHFRWRSAHRGAEQFWAGVLGHDDVPRDRFFEFRREGQDIERVGRALVGTRIRADVAIVHDYESEWAYEHQYLTEETRQHSPLADLFRAASELGYGVDVVSPATDLARYKLVFGPRLLLMDDTLAGGIRRFVEQGGTFVLAAHSAVKDRDNAVTSGPVPALLGDVFGVAVEATQCYAPPSGARNGLAFDDSVSVAVHVVADVLRPTTAKVVASWTSDFFAGKPACIEQGFGQGTAVYYGSFVNEGAARYLVRRYASFVGLQPLVPDLPKEVEVTVRSDGRNDYLFVLNHRDEPVIIHAGEGWSEVENGKPVHSRTELEPFAWTILTRPAPPSGRVEGTMKQ